MMIHATNSVTQEKNNDIVKAKEIEHKNATSENIIIGLSVSVLVLALLVIVYFLYRSRKNRFSYHKVSKDSTTATSSTTASHKPKLTISLPQASVDELEFDSNLADISEENHLDIQRNRNRSTPPPPLTPTTPLTPLSPFPPNIHKTLLTKSVSLPVKGVYQGKDVNADGLWRNAVRKATNTQFLQTQPKPSKFSYCASGKIKFSLTYDVQNHKELTVKILDFIDLPLSRETGISIPFVKVYLYPQNAHALPLTEVSKNLAAFKLEILSFPKENVCTFYGCPINKLCSKAMKFVILDYDRFSRSEFVADCVVLLDEVSLEGEAIMKHLSIRKTHVDKDMGSLLISLCYQPNVSRMCIIVLKASGLPQAVGSHAPDHFVKISLTRNNTVLDKRRTRVIKKTVCPVFNERLVFPINNEDMRSLVFVFEVIRYDSKIKQEKIANVVLGNHSNSRQVTPHEIQHFNEMIDSPQRQIAEWHKLVV